MKKSRSIIYGVIMVTIIILLLVTMPVLTALAYTAGPNDAGTGTNETGLGTVAWQNPGDITTSGAPYATALLRRTNLVSNYLKGTDYGFVIPSSATIQGIEVVINRQSDLHNPSIEDNVVSLVKGGTIIDANRASTTNWPTSMGTATYGGATDLWEETWTPADINSPDFGVVLSALRQNNGNNDRTASVDYMQISVYFALGTATTTVECGTGTPITYGDSITCKATVSDAGVVTPTGKVDWTTNGIGSFDQNTCNLAEVTVGIAACSVVYTPDAVGTESHLITANYNGDANYTPVSGTDTVTVNKKPAAVTPNAANKIYGDPDPTLTGTLSGFLDADGVTATYSRTSGETVLGSPYTISATLNPTAVLSNYDIIYNTANFTITKRTITVTADAKSKVYGEADPTLTYQITSGSLAFFDAFSGTLTRVAGENVGTYAIDQGTLALNENYTLTYVGVDLTITPRPITVTADAKFKIFGEPDPALTYQITSGSLAFSDAFMGTLTRVAGESMGTYAIQQGSLALNANYILTYVGANLTITNLLYYLPLILK